MKARCRGVKSTPPICPGQPQTARSRLSRGYAGSPPRLDRERAAPPGARRVCCAPRSAARRSRGWRRLAPCGQSPGGQREGLSRRLSGSKGLRRSSRAPFPRGTAATARATGARMEPVEGSPGGWLAPSSALRSGAARASRPSPRSRFSRDLPQELVEGVAPLPRAALRGPAHLQPAHRVAARARVAAVAEAVDRALLHRLRAVAPDARVAFTAALPGHQAHTPRGA